MQDSVSCIRLQGIKNTVGKGGVDELAFTSYPEPEPPTGEHETVTVAQTKIGILLEQSLYSTSVRGPPC